jgi:hypothetical protein
MLKIVGVVVLATALFGQSPAKIDDPKLPEEIKAWLDQNVSAWKLTPIITKEVRDRHSKEGVDYAESFIWGDFDGDGQRDYVVGVNHPGPNGEFQMEFAFLHRANRYEQRQLTSARAPDLKPDLDIAKKGSSFTEYQTNKKVECLNDCIRIVPQAGVKALFRYENGDFRLIYTID